MSQFWIIIIIAIVAVGLMVLALSLTLIFRGHNIRSEIGDNPNMKALGIDCAAKEGGGEEDGSCDLVCKESSCSSCETASKNN